MTLKRQDKPWDAPKCGHWHGVPGHLYCGSTRDVRRYGAGFRCPDHTPARVAGRPEPPNPPPAALPRTAS